MRGGGGLRVLICLAVLGASGCVGAVDRADFEVDMRARGGGLVSALPGEAVTALTQRLNIADLNVNVLVLTAPNSAQFRLVLTDQPDQVTRFLVDNDDLAARYPAARLRISRPDRPRQLDDYAYMDGALGSPHPVRVSAADDLDTENFAVSEVTGLARLEEIVDTARTRSELPDGQVTVIVVSRFGPDIRIVANVVSPRTEVVAEFDHTGTFLRVRQV